MNIAEIFKKPDFGLLIIRLVVGVTFVIHGLTKFIGGSPVLEKVGGALEIFGITAMPVFFGGIAALFEMLGGCLVFLGYKFRFATFAIFVVMAVAVSYHLESSHSFSNYAHSLEIGTVFLGLIFLGPGKYSFDRC